MDVKLSKKILAGVLTGTILLSTAPMALAADVSPAMVGLNGQTYYRLRDVAAMVSGTQRQFDVLWNNGVVISTGTAYTGEIPEDAPTAGTMQELNLKVNDTSVTTSVVLAGGNYYVTADFLSVALGVRLL